MKKRWTVLLLVFAMLISLAVPAMAADPVNSAKTVASLGTLSNDFKTVTGLTDGSEAELTWSEAIAYLLLESGMPKAQLGTYPGDYIGMADSLGMISYDEGRTFAKANTAITDAEFTTLAANSGLTLLTAAFASGKATGPLFVNGLAQPIFPYTTGAVTEGYDNADSDIIRLCVYVETNYDTDGDGKLDLVKALVQIPRAAAEGSYKAATIYEARP